MLNKNKNNINITLLFKVVKYVLVVPSIKLDQWQNRIWHFSLRAEKGNESGKKKCTRIKLRLKLMEHDTMSGGFHSMLATLCKINIQKVRRSHPVTRYPDWGMTEVTELIYLKTNYYHRNEKALNETHLTKNSTVTRTASRKQEALMTPRNYSCCHVSIYHVQKQTIDATVTTANSYRDEIVPLISYRKFAWKERKRP
jgi:hypothetical protein